MSNQRMSNQSFVRFASELVGEEVEVITNNETFTGTLEYVGSDHLILVTRVRGRRVRLAIRIALIIALFRLLSGRTFTL
ncbi:hypothetical protein COJ85_01455 [Bacillus sp. AFS076308]|uniref:hypothetical protein n=1 Tax=unclassified Bacillus (in: firmicutes) TaxID=185979 RepID=UPI000BF8F78E|nr:MULTISPECIES: hypothetical protein [unclassified Bacillus (in: firmicutes)]PFO09644.1 hypothetical protein COJ85_01455 [Bacillus sp. AFS076308]PGV54810.1 hypothetical protein COD92_03625 [Bacillus sp. AFS037270]